MSICIILIKFTHQISYNLLSDYLSVLLDRLWLHTQYLLLIRPLVVNEMNVTFGNVHFINK